MCLMNVYYLSGLVRDAALTIDMFEWLKDLCPAHVSPHRLHLI